MSIFPLILHSGNVSHCKFLRLTYYNNTSSRDITSCHQQALTMHPWPGVQNGGGGAGGLIRSPKLLKSQSPIYIFFFWEGEFFGSDFESKAGEISIPGGRFFVDLISNFYGIQSCSAQHYMVSLSLSGDHNYHKIVTSDFQSNE